MSNVSATLRSPSEPWLITIAPSPGAGVTIGSPGMSVAFGSGVAGRGVWSGRVCGSTTALGMISRTQPTWMRPGAYASDSGSRLG